MDNHNYYVVIPAYILMDKTLSDKQKLLIGLISNLSNIKGYCFASNKYISECLACSENTVRHLISDLEERNFIGRVIKLNGKQEVEFRTLSVITPPLKFEPPSPQKSAHPSPQNRTHNNKEVNNKEEYNNTTCFSVFWDMYDKKTDTAKCMKKWAAMPDNDKQQALKFLPSYIIKTKEKKYRKNPLTWLNGKCWLDEDNISIKTKPIHQPLANNDLW